MVTRANVSRRARLDQRAFAERVGLSKSALARIERGHTTTLPVGKLLDLVEAGGCSVVVLDPDGRPLRHTREDNAWIDRAGRRTPVHLDVYSTFWMGTWWGDNPMDWTWRARRTQWTFERRGSTTGTAFFAAYAGRMSTATRRADVLPDVTSSEATLRRFLHGLPGVDQVGAEARAAGLATRSIKTDAKAFALDLAIRMIDLTTLEGADTPGKVRALCAKAQHPDPTDPTGAGGRRDLRLQRPRPDREGGAGRLRASRSPQSPRRSRRDAPRMDVKLADTRDAVRSGADEVDMVIDRGAFLSGRYLQVFDEIRAVKAACADDGHDGAPQGDPRDRRAADLRQRPAGVVAGDAGRRRLHQDRARARSHPPRRCR